MSAGDRGARPARSRCPRCLRPLPRAAGTGPGACLCPLVQPVDNPSEVLILQHPLEQHQAKGTARLLSLCLRRSAVRIGELQAPPANPQSLYELLLYPDTLHRQDLAPAPLPDPARLRHPAGVRLLVIDGTWRKSLKMLHLNPWLQALPRLALDAPPASQYRIRRAQAAHQLSTLEATALALQQLDGREQPYAPLWAVMQAFVQRQQALQGQT